MVSIPNPTNLITPSKKFFQKLFFGENNYFQADKIIIFDRYKKVNI